MKKEVKKLQVYFNEKNEELYNKIVEEADKEDLAVSKYLLKLIKKVVNEKDWVNL